MRGASNMYPWAGSKSSFISAGRGSKPNWDDTNLVQPIGRRRIADEDDYFNEEEEETPAPTNDEDDDPLDAFMATVNQQVEEQKSLAPKDISIKVRQRKCLKECLNE